VGLAALGPVELYVIRQGHWDAQHISAFEDLNVLLLPPEVYGRF